MHCTYRNDVGIYAHYVLSNNSVKFNNIYIRAYRTCLHFLKCNFIKCVYCITIFSHIMHTCYREDDEIPFVNSTLGQDE